MTNRPLNWAGRSAETIAAVYETDAACREMETGDVDWGYVSAAAMAEMIETITDRPAGHMPDAQEPDLIKSA